jgi:hypothetical protein
MEYIKSKSNIFIKFLKKAGLLSLDLIYRFNFMSLFGSKLYFRHKIKSFRSCAFCKHLCYDSTIKKYVCCNSEYEASKSLVPCIVPDSSFFTNKTYVEEELQIPWLFREPCLEFEVLKSNNYFKNFLSFKLNDSIIRLEALEGILTGSCSGDIPCHICAGVDKELFTKCKNVQKACTTGKCDMIYCNLNQYFIASSKLSNVS